MQKDHKKLLAELKRSIRKERGGIPNPAKYAGSTHIYLNVSAPDKRKIAKNWIRQNREILSKDFIATLDSLYKGKTHEEKTLASLLLEYGPEYRKEVKLKHLDAWLGHLVGWAEVDSLCQSVFTAEELLANWKEWESLMRKLSKDKNIHKRRASLVLLTGPTHRSGDERLARLAFETIDRLKHEKDILITKAISWLLRNMSHLHTDEVVGFLKSNEGSLPKIAVRETWRKIKTGRK